MCNPPARSSDKELSTGEKGRKTKRKQLVKCVTRWPGGQCWKTPQHFTLKCAGNIRRRFCSFGWALTGPTTVFRGPYARGNTTVWQEIKRWSGTKNNSSTCGSEIKRFQRQNQVLIRATEIQSDLSDTPLPWDNKTEPGRVHSNGTR